MPSTAVRRPRTRWRMLGLGALVLSVLALPLDLVVAPPDAVQGQFQRLMYLHVPAAWTAYACFFVVLVASIGVLVRGSARFDAFGLAAAELGVGMTGLTLVEGSIWGHSVWGTWWTWDPRLVSTAMLFLVYAGYLAVRALPAAGAKASRRAAVLGVVGFVDVPIVHFSVLWWRSLHQPPTLLAPSASPPIDWTMLFPLMWSLVAFTLFAAWFVLRRVDQLTAPTTAVPAAPVPERVEVTS